jgi:hypothetical protein
MAFINQSPALDQAITSAINSSLIGRGFDEAILRLATAKVPLGQNDPDTLMALGMQVAPIVGGGQQLVWSHEAKSLGYTLYFVGTEEQVLNQVAGLVAGFSVDDIDWEPLEAIFASGVNTCVNGEANIERWGQANLPKIPRNLSESTIGMPASLTQFRTTLLSFASVLSAWKLAIQIRKKYKISENMNYPSALPPDASVD